MYENNFSSTFDQHLEKMRLFQATFCIIEIKKVEKITVKKIMGI